MPDTLWCGSQADKLYKNSGFTSTQLDSIDVNAVDTDPLGISWDDTNTLWCGNQADKLYKQSAFTSTQKTSVDVSGVDTTPTGITWDGTNTLWTGAQADRIYKNSGFTSTQLDSIDVSAVDANPFGTSWDRADTLLCGLGDKKLYKQSGFSSTNKDSFSVNGIDVSPTGISWNGFDAIWSGDDADKLYKQSGFSSTQKDSIDVSGVDTSPYGIGHGNFAERIGAAPANIFYETRFQKGVRVKHKSRCINVGYHLIDFARRYHTGRGKYRIFNTAEYRFYRANTATMPSAPFDTNASLPHTPTDTFANGTWYLWVTYYNGIYDSGPRPIGPNGEEYLRLDISAGEKTVSPPSGPSDFRIEKKASGVIRIAGYYYQPDVTLRAGEWAIAYTTNGSTPATDMPDETQSMPSSGVSLLSYNLPGQSNGTTVKVRLQTRRNDGSVESPSWTYSENSSVLTETADATGPSASPSGETWEGII